MLRAFKAAAAAIVVTALAGSAGAQDFPNGPVSLVVPYPPGGQIDMIARLLQPGMEKELGVPVVVENRPGAGGMVGTGGVFRSRPDGQTIVLSTDGVMTLNPLVFREPGYDPVADAAPVTIVSESVLALAVKADSDIESVADLVEKSKSERITYAGSGAPQQIVGELINQRADAKMVFVPYPGVAQALTDVLGGHVTLGIGTISSVNPHVRADGLKIIALSNAERLEVMPDMPVIGETAEGVVANTWAGIFAPAGTPEAVVEKLNAAVVNALKDPTVRERLESTSETIVAGTPAESGERVKRDLARWAGFLETVDIPKQ